MTKKDFVARGSAWIQRAPEDGKDAVSYEILLDTDSVVLKSDTKKFETHKLGDVHFIYRQGSYTEDMTSRIIETYSYIILYYGYEPKKDDKGNEVLGSDGKQVMEYKAITYSSNEGVTDIYNTMQMNVGDDADCYGMKYIWYDKNLPDNDEVMFEKIWSELDGVPPQELGIKILATKMFTVRREADSVQSSDVMFAIGDSKTTAPTTGWITNFGGLTLVARKYVWTCTKTTLTNGTSYYTGAYCLGDCYDFARVDELYALSDSSTNSPNVENFSSSYKVVKGKYLWSCVKVTYSGGSIDYLNIRCVNYFPNDGTNGTKFTPKGTAYGHYEASSKMPEPSDDVLGLLYLVDKVDTLLTPINKPCVVWWRSFSDSSYMLSYDASEEGDAYNIGGTLWVNNGTVWKDFGSIQGPKGDDGEDALSIELSTEKILFDYYEGNFDPQNKAITLVVRQGGNVIKSSEYNVKIVSSQNFDIDTDYLTIEKQDSSCTLNCYANGVNTYTYTYNDGVSYVTYPASSCSIKISVEYNGITYFKELSIEVSFVKMYGGLSYDTESLSSTYGELVGEGGRLSTMETNITQNAENIKLTATRTDGLEKQYSEIKVSYNSISAKVASTEKGLLDTGINITKKTIKMTANNFTLYNNKGEETFSADEYGNGVFKGKVTATSGYIGGCEIYDDSYEIEGTSFNRKGLRYQIDADGYMPQHVVNMRDRGFYVDYGDSAMGGYFRVGKTDIMVVSSGDKKELSYGYFFEVSMFTTASVTGQSAYAAKLKAASNASGKATALEANAYGGKENYAVDAINGDIRVQNGDFRAENGAFIGVHRDNVTKIYNSDYTLKKTDSTIVCNNTANDISIYLPSDAVVGTFYRIIKKGKTVTLISANKNIGVVNNIDLKSSVSSGTAREWINCLYDGDCWNVEMSRS
nr:MAG TPA: tail protein [Caudoviricetes sp.]